ncbi:hypothetical protein HUG15_18940 [Salicibibacter cibarius]|uniref:ABC transporter permease n=1 Tax=Salicibibacter cibarius TaxID=2743000 RepID=A0A7T7CCZ5_9BACI|nr:hypothetical protein [Salicibibacter cibarius]QQK77449.1 hypothetical protein HUG15_18940 [Salicibibacter cibarius]
MKEIFRLALFEWKQTNVRGHALGLMICVLYAGFIYVMASMDSGWNVAKGVVEISFLFAFLTLGNVHLKGFRSKELSTSKWSSPYYTYARRLPIPEKRLFYSRMLVKGLQGPVIMTIAICFASLFTNVFSFTFTDPAFYSFLVFWAAIAFIPTYTALEEIGIYYRKRVHLYSGAYFILFLYLLIYLVVWIWLVPFDGTFMAFSIYLAEEADLLWNVVIPIIIVCLTLLVFALLGRRRIKRKGGDVRASPD